MLPAVSPDRDRGTRPRYQSETVADRRIARRLPIEIDVTVEGGAHRFRTQTADLSPGGMFVETVRGGGGDHATTKIPIETHVMLSFKLPNGATFEVLGVVKWARRAHDDGRMPGLGIAFFCMDPEQKSVLENFCAVRDALY